MNCHAKSRPSLLTAAANLQRHAHQVGGDGGIVPRADVELGVRGFGANLKVGIAQGVADGVNADEGANDSPKKASVSAGGCFTLNANLSVPSLILTVACDKLLSATCARMLDSTLLRDSRSSRTASLICFTWLSSCTQR